MTDKEIIIDGVDVSECFHIDNYKHCNCCNDLIKTIYPKATKCHIEEDLRCESYPNCYFKQLKRKGKECEEINLTNERLVTEKYVMNKEILRLKVDEKSLLNVIDDLQKTKNEWEEKYNDLGQDFEQYKHALDEIEATAGSPIATRRAILDIIKKVKEK